jgi:hypothetical protein
MQRALIVGGVLGLGTAAVFGAAAVASALFPNGSTVAAAWNGGGMWDKGGVVVAPGPVPIGPGKFGPAVGGQTDLDGQDVPIPIDGGPLVVPDVSSAPY